MNDLSLKPKLPEKEKQSVFERKRDQRKVFFVLLTATILVSLLSFFLVTINKIKDDKIKKEAIEDYIRDSVKVRTVIRIDTVYIPGKVVESNFEACYDVSDANHILVTVKNGVVEVTNND